MNFMKIGKLHLWPIMMVIVLWLSTESYCQGSVPLTTQIYLVKILCPDVQTLGVMTSNLDDRVKQILASQQMTPPRQIKIKALEVANIWDITNGLNTLIQQEHSDAVLLLDSELMKELPHRSKRAVIDFTAKRNKKLITFNRDWVESGAFMGFEKTETIKILFNGTTLSLLQYGIPTNLSPDIQQMIEILE